MTTRLLAEERASRSAAPIAAPPDLPRRCRDGDVLTVTVGVTPRAAGAPPLPEDALRVRAMRRIAAATLRYCGLEAMTDEVMVAVSELITNAIMHSGGTSVTLSMTVQDDALTISVQDGGAGRAVPRAAGTDEESGRGLLLLDFLVRESGGSWGTSEAGGSTWCRFALPAGGAR
ncbi:ATP-binding protein [Streptomyces sp. NRRL S-31]|uniref:ATP-binding protein n=1 Tax=Streptomyces sp. NRRL S-31 TaxID=1463898 RepID=UPI00265742F8|nr:ATP-binding protein [Streptomyces sp. NRRL S-31]